MTAPTYTSTRARDRNSASSSIQRAALLKKASTRKSAAYTGLRTVTTISPAKTRMPAKR